MYKKAINIFQYKKKSRLVLCFFLLHFLCFKVSGQFPSNYPCYAIASNNQQTDSLFKYLPNTNFWVNLGALENVNVKAMAINPFDEILYATTGPVFGTIDTANISFESMGLIGPAYKGDYGGIVIQDVVGLAYDTFTKRLFGINRITTPIGNSGQINSSDILIELNCTTGKVVQNAFEDSDGNPADYAVIGEVNDGTLQDFIFDSTDLAFDPFTGELLVAQDQDSPTYLTSINKLTGAVEFVLMEVPSSQVSGLAFTESGYLMATTLNNATYGSEGKLLEIVFLAGYTNDYGFIDFSFNNYAFHCLDCFVRKPGCYDTLYLNNSNSPYKKYNANGDIEIDLLVNVDTLDVTSASEILLKNNFEVPKINNFSAEIDLNICQ